MKPQSERLLNKREIAELLNTSGAKAERVLRERGIFPIVLGKEWLKRSRDKRWLYSSVQMVILELHADAQGTMQGDKPKLPKLRLKRPVSTMSVTEILELTQSPEIQ